MVLPQMQPGNGYASDASGQRAQEESIARATAASSRATTTRPGAKKPRAKAKGKGKAKAKATSGKRSCTTPASNSAGLRLRHMSLKARLSAETKGRSVDELLRLSEAAKAAIAECDAMLKQQTESEIQLLTRVDAAQASLREAASKTDAVVRSEMSCLERLRASQLTRVQASKAAEEAQGSHDDVAKQIAILELEVHRRDKAADVEAAKLAAQEAVTSARHAAAELKAKEKQAIEAAKAVAKGQEKKTALMLREQKAIAVESCRGDPTIQRAAMRREMAELKEIQKMRADREKARQHGLKQLISAKRSSLPMRALPGQPAKIARIQDAD